MHLWSTQHDNGHDIPNESENNQDWANDSKQGPFPSNQFLFIKKVIG